MMKFFLSMCISLLAAKATIASAPGDHAHIFAAMFDDSIQSPNITSNKTAAEKKETAQSVESLFDGELTNKAVEKNHKFMEGLSFDSLPSNSSKEQSTSQDEVGSGSNSQEYGYSNEDNYYYDYYNNDTGAPTFMEKANDGVNSTTLVSNTTDKPALLADNKDKPLVGDQAKDTGLPPLLRNKREPKGGKHKGKADCKKLIAKYGKKKGHKG